MEHYDDAVTEAIRETGLAESAFPASAPYTIEHITDPRFLPE